jgi:hypothetical protein
MKKKRMKTNRTTPRAPHYTKKDLQDHLDALRVRYDELRRDSETARRVLEAKLSEARRHTLPMQDTSGEYKGWLNFLPVCVTGMVRKQDDNHEVNSTFHPTWRGHVPGSLSFEVTVLCDMQDPPIMYLSGAEKPKEPEA